MNVMSERFRTLNSSKDSKNRGYRLAWEKCESQMH